MTVASRSVQPEILDELAPEDPRALASRRDLARLNAVMMQAGAMARLLAPMRRLRGPRILELGSGDGSFMLDVARKLRKDVPAAQVFLLDRQPVVSRATLEAFALVGWSAEVVRADVFDHLGGGAAEVDVVCANLFLHHFDAARLRDICTLAAARCRLFAACEPRRDGLSLAASHLVGALGCNDVTRHDAVVSVRAGFRGRDISDLWPAEDEWTLRERRVGPFTHGFQACRDGSLPA